MKETAQLYHSYGLSVMPIEIEGKVPTSKWKHIQAELSDVESFNWNNAGIGIACGEGSGMLEVVDIDTKQDNVGDLFQKYKRAINDADKNLLTKLVVEQTPSGGFHFIYRCSKIEGNLKLASRHSTEEELLNNPKEKVKCLLETRGRGGYFKCFPSIGYKMLHGSLEKIAEITPDERDILIDIARTFNSVFEEVKHKQPTEKRESKGIGCFDDYNDRGDLVSLLEKHGWTVKMDNAKKTMVKRSGQSDSIWSADYDKEKKLLYIFSSSTEFEPNKAYNHSSVYCKLEADDNWKECAKKLYDDGYGERIKPIEKEQVFFDDNDYSYIAGAEEISQYVMDVRDGNIVEGKSWGIEMLNHYWKYKPATFNVINGFPNIGKSTVFWYVAALSTITLKLRWLIYSSENRHQSVSRKLLEFRMGKSIKDFTNEELIEAMDWFNEYFLIIREDNFLSFKDVITLCEKSLKFKKFDCLLVDPYNSLKLDKEMYRTYGGHEYHYQAASLFRIFCKTYGISMYLNCHPDTAALRQKPDGKGIVAPPNMGDIEGGGKWANKADDFLTLHRQTQHPDLWKITEIYVRKIKEYETGGKPTPFDAPVKLQITPNACGFTEETGRNPMMSALGKQVNPVEKYEPPKRNYYEKEQDDDVTPF